MLYFNYLQGARKRKQAQTPFEDALTETLTSLKKSPVQDEFDHFCLSLAPELRKIGTKRPKVCMSLKIQIQQLILDAASDSE